MYLKTYIHEASDGRKIEYRRVDDNPVVLHLESRVLRPDGTPYDDGWYRVTDEQLCWLQRDGGADLVQNLVYAI